MLYVGIRLVELKVTEPGQPAPVVTSVTWSSCSVTEIVSLVEASRDVEVSLLMFFTVVSATWNLLSEYDWFEL
jgi:hypothetical protein